MKRFKNNSTLEYAGVMSGSDIFNTRDEVATPILALNIAYSSRIDGGLGAGITLWAGPSKHFKSMFCLISAASYLKKYPDAVCLFYDNEFGSPKAYFESVGIDPDRVLHSPFFTLEELRTDIVNQLKMVKRGDKVVIVIDSLGLAASEKEVKDAEDGSEKADMTRAKINKSLFRIITPHLRIKDIPLLAVAHVYDTIEMYSKKVVSGGSGQYLAADNIYIIGRQQDKQGKELLGYDFIINVEKSRYTREKSKIPVKVSAENGIDKWTGLFDMAIQAGIIERTGKRYHVIDTRSGEVLRESFYRKAVERSGDFWRMVFEGTAFEEWITNEYRVTHGDIISDVNDEDEIDLNLED
jgi:RecA/RadA recombinase